MRYPLAKELKDAGFPQGGDGTSLGPPDKIVWRRDDRVYRPTLAELIEGCGSGFRSVERLADGDWQARADRNSADGTVVEAVGRAQAIDEAVAHLWLALNKGP
jgi:hypothetical protein